jgi:hypothetical protein
MRTKKTLIMLALILIAKTAAAANPALIIRDLICDIWDDLIDLIIPLATLMFIYGGAKYAFSADDPGGRKQAKSICLHALIGLIIVASAEALVEAAGGPPGICP